MAPCPHEKSGVFVRDRTLEKDETMRVLLFCLVACCVTSTAMSQYYYKDLVLTGRTMRQLQDYRSQKVHGFRLSSFESDNTPTRDFIGEVSIDPSFTTSITHTKSAVADESQLTALFNTEGRLVQTVDTTDGSKSVTDYEYEKDNRITTIRNATSSTGQETETETHFWRYNTAGKPQNMLRIRDGADTTFVSFVLDEKGNVTEEKSVRNGSSLPTVYYYYDDANRLTDVVRYNARARRLLPDYIFEYATNNRISSMIVVPEGSSDYQKWYYTYNEKGLKSKETCYNKHKDLLGRIEYSYSF